MRSEGPADPADLEGEGAPSTTWDPGLVLGAGKPVKAQHSLELIVTHPHWLLRGDNHSTCSKRLTLHDRQECRTISATLLGVENYSKLKVWCFYESECAAFSEMRVFHGWWDLRATHMVKDLPPSVTSCQREPASHRQVITKEEKGKGEEGDGGGRKAIRQEDAAKKPPSLPGKPTG